MNLKTKAFGLVAAGILGFSALTGTALAETTTATLNQNPNGTCSAVVGSSDVNFGTYVWDANLGAYVVTTPSDVGFNVSQTYGPGITCDVTVKVSALTSATDTISIDDIVLQNLVGSGTLHSPTYPGYGSGALVVENGIGAYSASIYLNGLWGSNYDVGVYHGTITVTAVQAAP